MDFTKNLVLKENYTFLVATSEGAVVAGEHGLYDRDTRFLSRYAWRLPKGFQTLLAHSPRPDTFTAHHACIEGPSQVTGIRRQLTIQSLELTDRLDIENTGSEAQQFTIRLELAADFCDLFEARGWLGVERAAACEAVDLDQLTFRHRAADGLDFAARLSFTPTPAHVGEGSLAFDIALAPGERAQLAVATRLEHPLARGGAGIDYREWREAFPARLERESHQRVLAQAVDDLRALLLFTEHGPVPAAGVPWFVAVFGRDALLSAHMMLPHFPEVAAGTLRYLAAFQGQTRDDYRAEEPGKIMHELRFGELTRMRKTPHGPYYGSIDATALFVMLLHETWRTAGRLDLLEELKPSWEAALTWLSRHGDLDGDRFLEFVGSEGGAGLAVQSWKDSHDSLSHASGALAAGAIAVSEVQGYAYAAYSAAADFYTALGDRGRAEGWREQAAALQSAFHEAFWLPDLGTYALALDGDKKPLAVHNSDAGQLLWTGIVPRAFAPRLIETLLSEPMWSGWGIRTLGRDEARYNPVSYHNGSVWPHDNALIAAGMAAYGFTREAETIREALFDLAASQHDRRLPELIAGYDRTDAPPVPYPVACRPQAWDAAALLYLLRL